MNIFIDIVYCYCNVTTFYFNYVVQDGKRKKEKERVKEKNFKRIFSTKLYIFIVRYINVIIYSKRLNRE